MSPTAGRQLTMVAGNVERSPQVWHTVVEALGRLSVAAPPLGLLRSKRGSGHPTTPDLDRLIVEVTEEPDRPDEMVQLRLRRGWYAQAMRAMSDQGQEDDLLIDLVIEVTEAISQARNR
jgi:hypothetical protein